MPESAINAVLDQIVEWAERTSRPLGGNTSEAQLLLQLAHDYLGIDDPADLAAGDLEELLLEVYPRKVTVLEADDAADVIPTVRDILAFLDETGRVPAKEIKRLRREVDRIQPRFLDAVMDPANWGPARALTQAMAADGIDLADQAAMDRWIAEHNARLTPTEDTGNPYEEDIDLKDAFGLPDRLPPLRLPPEAVLADEARTSRRLARARELALWVGGRRRIENGELTAGDAGEAAQALGIPVAEKDPRGDVLPGMPNPPAIRRMRDVPELVHLWRLAEDVEFLEFSPAHVTVAEGVEDWPGGDDEDVLDVWETAFASILANSLPIDADLHDRHDLDFVGVGAAVMVMLFLARGEGIPLAELSEMIRETATAELSPTAARRAWQSWIKSYGDPARTLFARLVELGAVTCEDEVVRVGPLAAWAIRDQLVHSGVDVPLLPPVEQMRAADLFALAEGSTEEELAAEEAAWLKLRTPEDAVQELLDAAAEGGPAARLYATSVASRIGAAAEPQWRAALDDHRLRPYAKIALAQLAGTEPPDMPAGLEPSREDLAWLLTDVLAATSDALEPADLEQRLREAVPPGQEQVVFDTMWRLSHPAVPNVLTMIGAHHPDKKIAKAARKAAFKASTRRA